MRLLHTRMAVASWMLQLGSLVSFALAGNTSILVRPIPVYAREHALVCDIAGLTALLIGLALATWCLTGGRKHLWPHYVIHAKIGVGLATLVSGLAVVSIVIKQLYGSP